MSLAALAGAAVLLVVYAYPLTHSPRFDALELPLREFASLDEFRRVATQNNIPLEPDETGERPDLYTSFKVPLDGSMRGETLYLKFRNDKKDRLSEAIVVGRRGKGRMWWRTHW